MPNIRLWLRERKERERVVLMYGPQKCPSIEEIDVELARFDQEMVKKGLLTNEDERIRQLLLKTRELLGKPVVLTPEPVKVKEVLPEEPVKQENLSNEDVLRILNGTRED